MKKTTFKMILSLCIGCLLSYIVISGYKDMDTFTLSKGAKEVYYLRSGVYSSKESMTDSMKEFSHYIYNVEDNKYHAYIAISGNKKNIQKIKDFYEKMSYNTYIETKITDNKEFLTVLNQYDEILLKTDDTNAIKTIVNQVIAKYEEMVNGEYKN